MAQKHASLVIPRTILDLVRIRRRRSVLLVGTYPLRPGKLDLCTQDANDGVATVAVSNVLQGALGDMPLRVLHDLGKSSMADLLGALQASHSDVDLSSRMTLVEWSVVVSDRSSRVEDGQYILSHEEMAKLLAALRPFIDKARGARSMADGLHSPGSIVVTPLQLAAACSAYHLINDRSRRGPQDKKDG